MHPLIVPTSMNQQLCNFQKWLDDNRMKLNLKKSCVIWFHTRCQRDQSYPDIVVNHVKLPVVTKQKYLGLMFIELVCSGFMYMSEDGLLPSFD